MASVEPIAQHSEFYYATYLERIAGPKIEAITTWMDENPELITSVAGRSVL